MDFRLPDNAEAFRQEVVEFLDKEWPPAMRMRLSSTITHEEERAFSRKLGKKGWLCMWLPEELGGTKRSLLDQYVFVETMSYYGAPSSSTAATMVGPTLWRIGTEDQKSRFLPPIARGEIDFALGYSEPNAGTDLASLQLRAVKDGDEYVLNVTKMFTSLAHKAEFCWLAARTDPDLPKHKGISIFIVDMKSPGITIRPLWTMGGLRTNQTFWDNVRVPANNLVGELNKGWYYLATALDFERIGGFPIGRLRIIFDRLVDFVKSANFDGVKIADDHAVRAKLAELSTRLEVVQMLSYRAAWIVNQGSVPNYEASSVKILRTELEQEVGHIGTQVLRLYGQLIEGSKHAPLDGYFETQYEGSVAGTFGAGSNEIQRQIIATRGLGLPR